MITWDEPKRLRNLRDHGIDFTHLENVFDFPMVTEEDKRQSYGELRLRSLGLHAGRVVFLVWTERQRGAHIISCRYAERHETKTYFAAL